MENLKKLHPWLTDAELEVFAELPKKEDGKTYDVEAMDAEQKALYYKDRSEASTAGFQKYKTEKDIEIEGLKKDKKPASETLTEDDLEKKIPGYSSLSDSEKNLIKQTIAPFAKNLSELSQEVAKLHDKQSFEDDFDNLIQEDEYKVLAQHRRPFKAFAYKDENISVPLSILADSYIRKNNLKDEDEETRRGLEEGNGGDRKKLSTKKGMDAVELETLRKSDPRRYNRLAKEGKLAKETGLE